MSWSTSATGTPDEVVDHLTKYGATLTGQSKVEFDAALPHLTGLVKENFDNTPGQAPSKLSLSAYGSGFAKDGQQVNRSCGVTLKSA